MTICPNKPGLPRAAALVVVRTQLGAALVAVRAAVRAVLGGSWGSSGGSSGSGDNDGLPAEVSVHHSLGR